MTTSNVRFKKAWLGNRGFSLMELLVSVGIVATVLVYIIGVFTTGMRANRKSVDLTSGTLVAESVISQELCGLLEDTAKSEAFFDRMYDGSQPILQGTQTMSNTKFTYKLFVSDLDKFAESGNKMKKVDCQVWWWVPDEATSSGNQQDSIRAGYGVCSVGVTRLVNQQSKF